MNEFFRVSAKSGDLPTIISFSSVNTPVGRFKPFRIVECVDANVVFVNDRGNRWYQQGIEGVGDNSKDAACDLVRRARDIGNGRVVTFGTSMGAYGAMLFAALGEADGCMAFGVESQLQLPGSRSARYMASDHPMHYPALRPLLEKCRVPMTLYISECDEVDLYAAMHLFELPCLTMVGIRGMEHPGVQAFDADGSIGAVLSKFAATGATPMGLSRQGVLLQHRTLLPLLWSAYQAKAIEKDKVRWLSLTRDIASDWPQHALVHLRLGEALYASSQGDEAAAAWFRAISLCPLQYEAHAKLGALLRRRGAFVEGAEHLRRSVEINPWHAHGHHGLGLAYQDMGQMDHAEEHFRRAVCLNRGNAAFKKSLDALVFTS